MITITVETDKEAALIKDVLSAAWRSMRGQAFIIVKDGDVIGSELRDRE